MECFRIDESGYTGFDLLNADQPYQGASAIAIEEQDAARLIKEYFPRHRAEEIKYRQLIRRPSNHSRLLALHSELLKTYKCATYACDKRFLLILMFLDHAAEPYYYLRGLDFYKDGQNYAMASLLSIVGPKLLGEDAFDQLLAAFQSAVKEKTPESLASLVRAARSTNWHEFPEALGPLAKYAAPECLSSISNPDVSTDAAFVVLQSLISRMEVMADGPYQVEHDRSKNLLAYNKILQKLIKNEQEIAFRHTSITTTQFPLKLAEVMQVDSKMNPGVQLADVLIGSALDATSRMLGKESNGLDPELLFSLYAENQFIYLMPSIDFEEQRRFRQGSQSSEFIDYIAEIFGRPTKD